MDLAQILAKIVYNKNGVEIGGISPTAADKEVTNFSGDVIISNPARTAGDTIFIKMEWIKHYAN